MSITNQTASHIAHLANLPLTEEEVEHFAPQLGSVLEYTQQAQQLDTKGVIETSQVTGLENVFRDDEIDAPRMFSQADALANATHTHNGYFVVPSVFEE